MKALNIAIAFIVLILIAYIAICIWLYKNQEMLLFFPQKIEEQHQFSFQSEFEEVYLTTPDGERLHGIYFSAPNPKGVIIAFHGNGDTLLSAGHEAVDFVNLGYDVLMPDYRSYGKSSGTLSENNLFNDAELFYKELIKRDWKAEDITIYGRSIGSGVASYLASKVGHKRVILTTPYFSMLSLASENYPFIPMSLILRYPLRNDLHLQKTKTPISILHGTSDSIIPFHQAERLHELIGANSTFTSIEGGDHNNLSNYEEYWSSIVQALDGSDSH